MTFDEKGFRNYLQEKELAPGTIYGYIGHCKKYFECHDTLSTKELIEYKEELRKDLKPQTVNGYVNALRAYIRYTGLMMFRERYPGKDGFTAKVIEILNRNIVCADFLLLAPHLKQEETWESAVEIVSTNSCEVPESEGASGNCKEV